MSEDIKIRTEKTYSISITTGITLTGKSNGQIILKGAFRPFTKNEAKRLREGLAMIIRKIEEEEE